MDFGGTITSFELLQRANRARVQQKCLCNLTRTNILLSNHARQELAHWFSWNSCVHIAASPSLFSWWKRDDGHGQ